MDCKSMAMFYKQKPRDKLNPDGEVINASTALKIKENSAIRRIDETPCTSSPTCEAKRRGTPSRPPPCCKRHVSDIRQRSSVNIWYGLNKDRVQWTLLCVVWMTPDLRVQLNIWLNEWVVDEKSWRTGSSVWSVLGAGGREGLWNNAERLTLIQGMQRS